MEWMGAGGSGVGVDSGKIHDDDDDDVQEQEYNPVYLEGVVHGCVGKTPEHELPMTELSLQTFSSIVNNPNHAHIPIRLEHGDGEDDLKIGAQAAIDTGVDPASGINWLQVCGDKAIGRILHVEDASGTDKPWKAIFVIDDARVYRYAQKNGMLGISLTEGRHLEEDPTYPSFVVNAAITKQPRRSDCMITRELSQEEALKYTK